MKGPVTMLTKPQWQQDRTTAKTMGGRGIECRTTDVTESERALAWALENDFRGPIVVAGERPRRKGSTLGRASGLAESPALPLGRTEAHSE